MPTGTVRLHRVLRAKPEKIYRAFVDAEALARWLPPNGFTCKVEHLDAKVGGSFRMALRNFSTGNAHSFGGHYLELVPDERIRYTDKFDDANLPGEMIDRHPARRGLRGGAEHRAGGFPRRSAEFCYLGWQESLEHLARLVEPEFRLRSPRWGRHRSGCGVFRPDAVQVGRSRRSRRVSFSFRSRWVFHSSVGMSARSKGRTVPSFAVRMTSFCMPCARPIS